MPDIAHAFRATCGAKPAPRGSHGCCSATAGAPAGQDALYASCALRACEPNEMSDSVIAVGMIAALAPPSASAYAWYRGPMARNCGQLKTVGASQPVQPPAAPRAKHRAYSAAAPTVASFEPSVMALRSGVYTAMVKGPPIAPATRSACSRSRARASTSTKASSMDIVCESDTAGWTRVERSGAKKEGWRDGDGDEKMRRTQ